MENKKLKQLSKIIFLGIIFLIITFLTLSKILMNISFGADDTKAIIESNLDKYINYKLSDQDKGTLIQYGVKLGIEYGEKQDYYPIKDTQIVIRLSSIDGKYPYAVKTITKSTQATNGKNDNLEASYEYDHNNGTVTIKASNLNEQGELIQNEKTGLYDRDEYKIIAYYDTYIEESLERQLAINTSVNINLLSDENATISNENLLEESVKENIGEITSINQIEDDIYNGYIKANIINGTNYTTQFNEIEEITVSKREAQEFIDMTENNTFIEEYQNENQENSTQDLGNNGDLVYKSSIFKKQNIQELLGEEGYIEIIDISNEEQNIIATINKDTEFDKNGITVINYDVEPENIEIRTSKIQNEGILYIEHIKEIKDTFVKTNDIKIKKVAQIGETIEASIIDIKDSQTNVELQIDNTNWTNKQQNEVKFNIYLDSSDARYNMFKNPRIQIELPNEVEKVILKGKSIVYANGLELEDPYVETSENGNLRIVANLKGEQSKYYENNLDLITDIEISATIILKKDIESKTDNVIINYTNQFTTEKQEEVGSKDIEIQLESYEQQEEQTEEKIEQQYQLATINNEISNINVDDIKLEVAPVKGDTSISNGDTIYEGEYIKYNVKITNNSEEDINNVKIVGNIPEGTIYAELEAEYYQALGKYQYNYDDTITTKEIEIGTLQAGESITKFYEVKVNNLGDDESEKETTSIIKAYVEEQEVANYQLNNVIKQAGIQVFVDAELDNNRDCWNFSILLEGDEVEKAKESEETKKVTVQVQFPEAIIPIYHFDSEGRQYFTNEEVSDNNTVAVLMDLSNPICVIRGQIDSSKITNKTEDSKVELTTVATVVTDNTYKSNENRIEVSYENVSIQMTSSNEGEKVKYGEEIDYEIKVTNIGKTNSSDPTYLSTSINVTDFLPEGVKPISMTYNNWKQEVIITDEEGNEQIVTDIEEEQSFTPTDRFIPVEPVTEDITGMMEDSDGNKLPDVNLYFNIPYQESVTIQVKTTADYMYEVTKIENSATVTGNNIDTKTSNIVSHIVLPYNYREQDNPDTPDDPDTPDTPDNPDTPGAPDNPEDKYSISGIAWLDENEDGQRQSSEKLLNEIKVDLIDSEQGRIIDNVVTISSGAYSFKNLSKGNYIVVFEYDNNIYSVTEYRKSGVSSQSNSDFTSREIMLRGNKIIVALTDIINLDASETNIDIGFTRNKTYDLKIDKYISNVVVNTNKLTKQVGYNQAKLAKVEIKPGQIEGANVSVEYKIVVTNEGEIPANITRITDYLPEGFSLSKNSNWVETKNGEVINTSTSNRTIQAGESIELTLVANKTMTSDTTGTFKNKVEISEATNQLGVNDTDSTPGNNKDSEDDFSSADIIISVSTGIIVYISIAIGILVVLTIIGVVVYFGRKHGWLKINKGSLFIVMILILMTSMFYRNISKSYNGSEDDSYEEYVNTINRVDTNIKAGEVGLKDGIYLWNIGSQQGTTWQSNDFFKVDSLDRSQLPIRDVYPNPQNRNGSTTPDAQCIEHHIWGYSGPYQWYGFIGEGNWSVESSSTSGEINKNFNLKGNNETYMGVDITTNKDYALLGPFKFTYDKPESSDEYVLKVMAGSSEEIKDYTIVDKNSKQIPIKAGTEFYLKMEKNLGQSVVSLKLSVRKTMKTTTTKSIYGKAIYKAGAELWNSHPDDYKQSGCLGPGHSYTTHIFVNGVEQYITIKDSWNCQDVQLINRYKYSKKETTDIIIENSINWYNDKGVLKIVKKDENGNPLKGVRFIIEHNLNDKKFFPGLAKNNRYLHRNEDGTIGYLPKSEATEFETDENGEIFIGGLTAESEVYRYIAYEVYNPHYGYTNMKILGIEDAKDDDISYKPYNPYKDGWDGIDLLPGTVTTVEVTNKKQVGKLLIEKKATVGGMSDYQKKNAPGLNGISFKIRDTDKKQWIIAIDSNGTERKRIDGSVLLSNLKYTNNINQATEFVTGTVAGENGRIVISNILTGTYDIRETSVGDNKGYYIDSDTVSWDASWDASEDLDKGTVKGKGQDAKITVGKRDIRDDQILYDTDPNRFNAKNYDRLTVYNERKYIKLSGYVWEDNLWSETKTSNRNEYYNDAQFNGNKNDVNDKLVQGIKVELKDRNGNVIKETVTDNQGSYIFDKVEISELSNYYIEFQYNGLCYQNVKLGLDKENGNKASEEDNRTAFNNSYATISKGKSNDYNLTYDESTEYESKLLYRSDRDKTKYNYGYKENESSEMPISGVDEQYIIRANTKNAYNDGYLDRIMSQDYIIENGIEEISNINLGILKRQQADLAVVKDLNTVKVSINNKEHIYKYADRFNLELYEEGLDGYTMEPRIKFENEYSKMSYTRALYASDVHYKEDDDKNDRELKVEVTYKIGIKNTGGNLGAVINELTDYYDTKYNVLNVGKEINEDGTIKQGTEITEITNENSESNDYEKITIKPQLEVPSQKDAYIYVNLEIKKDKIVEILSSEEDDDKVKLDNVVEINSYSIKDSDGNPYASIDTDSQPGNIDITDKSEKPLSFEDDTDKAPGLKLVLQEAREVSGNVFEDNPDNNMLNQLIRQGNGIYDEGETPIKGVTVQLLNSEGEVVKVYNEEAQKVEDKWTDAKVETDENGSYTIKGFIPDDYQICYEWGDKDHKVQDYKCTIVDKESYESKGTPQNMEWYKNDTDRYSDAIDDYTLRQEIDNQSRLEINSNSQTKEAYTGTIVTPGDEQEDLITRMTSTTPKFRVNIEYDGYTTNSKDEYETDQNGKVIQNGKYVSKKEGFVNHIMNIDFGIIQRPKQTLELEKYVKRAKITLADGRVVSDAEIENGKIKEGAQHVVYIPESSTDSQIRFELDDELIQSATLEIEYGLKVKNISETDYLNEEFYKYGTGHGEDYKDKVKLTPSGIIDYLDNGLVLNENTGWTIEDNNKNELMTKGLLSNELKDTLDSSKTVLTTDSLKIGGSLRPDESETVPVTLKAQRLLSTVSSNEDIYVGNDAEIIIVEKTGGASLSTTPGNYVPGGTNQEADDDSSEKVAITSPTGINIDYIAYTLLAISSLGILTVGIVLIKKLILR